MKHKENVEKYVKGKKVRKCSGGGFHKLKYNILADKISRQKSH
jgi:hypothetical protein